MQTCHESRKTCTYILFLPLFVILYLQPIIESFKHLLWTESCWVEKFNPLISTDNSKQTRSSLEDSKDERKKTLKETIIEIQFPIDFFWENYWNIIET